jgi:hypothetical protein
VARRADVGTVGWHGGRVPHRSRLAISLLDRPPGERSAGRDFWSAATGHPVDVTDEFGRHATTWP